MKADECPLGNGWYMSAGEKWVFGEKDLNTNKLTTYTLDDIEMEYRCCSDVQSHVNKGAFGIRIDGTKKFSLENVYVHDIINWGDLGTDACGEYTQSEIITGAQADPDMQYGYTGTNAHGIITDYCSGTMENIKIENVQSLYGTATGISIYKGSQIDLSGTFEIDTIIAGALLSKKDISKLKLPILNFS